MQPSLTKILLLVICISLGLDNFVFRSLPFEYLHPLRWVAVLSFLVIILHSKHLLSLKPLDTSLMFLFMWGFIISLVRFSLFYSDLEFSVIPIFRQSISFIIGFLVLKAFTLLQSKFGPIYFINAIILTSVVPLIYGIYEIYAGNKIGHYIRIDSFFSEPSYYGDYLALILAPSLLISITRSFLQNEKKNFRFFVLALFLINFAFLQSGTAILKLATLMCFFGMMFPLNKTYKFIIVAALGSISFYVVFFDTGYVHAIWGYVKVLYYNPHLFFTWEFYTIYDRFYSIYSSVINFFTFRGFIGLGFGGDYFELQTLFPPETHSDIIFIKPTMSYFTSFTAKFILYFGFLGVVFLIATLKTISKIKNPMIKAAAYNSFVASLWGLGNFSLPYMWLWIALSSTSTDPEIES